MEIHETILVLFIIVLIIVIGTFFYFRASLTHVQRVGDALNEQDITVLLASATALQEIRCSEKDCIDTSKLLPFQDFVGKRPSFYTSLLGSKKIVITQLYPEAESNTECTVTSYAQDGYPDTCQYWVIYDYPPSSLQRTTIVSTFASLFFPESGEFRIGRVEVISYA